MNRIKQAMKELGDNGGFYNPKKILKHFDSTMISFIVGERRIGKTDYFLHLACKLYIDYGVQTMWIRNKLVELQDPSFHSAFLNDAKLHGWCPEEWETRNDGVYASQERDAEQIILFQSISTFSNRRGGANPKVLMMVFDEFMPEDRKYPTQCAKGLLSLTKTVFSGNTEARVFCLSNIVSAVNPYFAGFRIYPKDVITYYADKGLVIEKCVGYKKAITHDNPWTKVYIAGNYGDYADESEDKIISLVVDRLPKDTKPYDFMIASNGNLYKASSNDKYVYFVLHKGNPIKGRDVFTVDRDAVSSRVTYMPSNIQKAIKEMFDNGYGRFVGANTLFDIMSIIYKDL